MRSLNLAIRSLLGAAAIASLPAHALPPSAYDGTQVDIFFGGATATDGILENNFRLSAGGICAAGTIDIYRVDGVLNRGNRVIFCRVTANQVPGFPASQLDGGGNEIGGSKVAFHKESIGGSSNGVVPLARSQNLEFFNMASAASCTGPTSVTGTGGLLTYNNWTACPDVTRSEVPHGGISDTEPHLSFANPPLTTTELNSLTSTPGLAIMFGVPVTENLYRALQQAQGLTLDDTQANVPTLTRSQVRGLYAQRITSWNQITTPAGTSITSGAPFPPTGAIAPATNDAVFICRRVATSGTQASFESYWLHQRCDAKNGSTGAPAFAGGNPIVGGTPNFSTRVTPGEGSGDVRSCLNAHDANGTWAIGVLSTEVSSANIVLKDGATPNPNSFRLVKIDGALPNLATVANGDYDFFTENTLNRRTGAIPTGPVLSLLTFLEANIGRPAVISLANSSFQGRPWGDGGVLTLASASAFAPNPPPVFDGPGGLMRTNPVNTQSRSLVNNRVNNCNPPVMTDPSPTP